MSMRLLLIETRRNAGLWFFPAILLVACWQLSASAWVAFLWSGDVTGTNEQLQASVVPFATTAIAGAAAWMAGRDRRRGMEELLDATPRPQGSRGLTLWAATALWGLLAYAAFAAFMMGRTALQATWGGPELWRVAIVIAAILAYSAWGFFFGSLVPSRFTAPAVAVLAMGLQLLLAGDGRQTESPWGYHSHTWVTYLAAHTTVRDLAPWQTLIYVGLTGAALAASALRSHRGMLRSIALTGSVALAVVGVVMVWAESPRYDQATGVTYNGWGRLIGPAAGYLEYMEAEPVCKGSPVTVCVHPEHQPVLEEGAASANRLAEPLLGLPGLPVRAGPGDVHLGDSGSGSMLELGPRVRLDVSRFADKLVADPGSMREGTIVNEAQLALRTWLIERAGLANTEPGCYDGMAEEDYAGQPTRRTCQAADRFVRLSPAEQRAWLDKHYTDLRAGTLTLEDLP